MARVEVYLSELEDEVTTGILSRALRIVTSRNFPCKGSIVSGKKQTIRQIKVQIVLETESCSYREEWAEELWEGGQGGKDQIVKKKLIKMYTLKKTEKRKGEMCLCE